MATIKDFLVIGITLLSAFLSSGQEIISTSGDYQTSIQGSLSWTIGEPITETTTSVDGILTQGFQQNYEDIVAIEEASIFDKLTLFPNPVHSTLQFEGHIASSNLNIEILDFQGKRVFNESILLAEINIKQSIDLSFLSNGMYTVVLSDDTRSHQLIKKIIKLSNTP